MKRDMDFVRDILLAIEGGQIYFHTSELNDDGSVTDDKDEVEKLAKYEHHLRILIEAGYVDLLDHTGTGTLVRGLTWQGHDFIETIRDPDLWRRTKEGASKAGGAGFAFIKEVAKAYAKSKLQELGVPLA